MTDEFPNNSEKSRREVPPQVEEDIEKIISGTATIKKPTGFGRFRRSFIAGDAHSVGRHVFWNLLLPALQDTAANLGGTMIDMMIYGEKGGNRFVNNAMNHNIPGASTSKIQYGGIVSNANAHLQIGPTGQQAATSIQLDPTQIVLNTKAEADVVMAKLASCLAEYHVVSVAQLYRWLGHTPAYTDNKWGWTNLDQATYRRTAGGIRLLLPQPEELH